MVLICFCLFGWLGFFSSLFGQYFPSMRAFQSSAEDFPWVGEVWGTFDKKAYPLVAGIVLSFCTCSCIFLETFVFSALCVSCPPAGCQDPKAGHLANEFLFHCLSFPNLEPGVLFFFFFPPSCWDSVDLELSWQHFSNPVVPPEGLVKKIEGACR